MSGRICIATTPLQRFSQSCERLMGSARDGNGDDDDDDGNDDDDDYGDDDGHEDGDDDAEGDDEGNGDDVEPAVQVHNRSSQKLNKEEGGLTASFSD